MNGKLLPVLRNRPDRSVAQAVSRLPLTEDARAKH
jgi:hypothetical protein